MAIENLGSQTSEAMIYESTIQRRDSTEFKEDGKGEEDITGFEDCTSDVQDHVAFTKASDVLKNDRTMDKLLSFEDLTINSTSASANKKKRELCFTCFPKLPFELRNLIWEAFCSKPQIIGVYVTQTVLPSRALLRSLSSATLHSQLLKVNHESRAVALKFYSPVTKLPPGAGHFVVMANLETDYLLPTKLNSKPWAFHFKMADIKSLCPPGRAIKVAMTKKTWDWFVQILESSDIFGRIELLHRGNPQPSNVKEILVLAGSTAASKDRVLTARKPMGVTAASLERIETEMEALMDLAAFAVETGRTDVPLVDYKCPHVKLRELYGMPKVAGGGGWDC